MTDAPIQAQILPVTPYQQNCSLVWCTKTKRAAVVDPGGEVDRLKAAIAAVGVTLEKVLLTHGHLDHASGATRLARDGNVYRLNGRKFHSTGVLFAHWIAVVANNDDNRGTIAFVPRDAKSCTF